MYGTKPPPPQIVFSSKLWELEGGLRVAEVGPCRIGSHLDQVLLILILLRIRSEFPRLRSGSL